MINDLNEKDKIVVEIRQLVNEISSAKEEINIYCDLVRQLFLSSSTNN